jgi:glycosyltransferase involved in cell wall biosynthesis
MDKSIKVARVATVPFFLDHQLRQQMEHLLALGFDVTAVTSSTGDWDGLLQVNNLQCIKLDIAREPSLFKDVVSLFKFYRLFKSQGFDIVHSTTPKAGLLCALAAFAAKTPVRLHTFTGQTWATKKGIGRWILRILDQFVVWLNTQCYADSESQRQYLIRENIGDKTSIKVLGKGSLAGVDFKRFNRRDWLSAEKNIHHELNISNESFVVTFIGRLSREKGVFELVDAFEILKKKYNNLILVLIGPCEELSVEVKLEVWKNLSGLHYVGATNTPERYLSVSHLLCLPSYREGFGTVVIEAAAMEVPTLGTNITGLCDAIEDNVTGILVPPKSVSALHVALDELIGDRALCRHLGLQAFERCQRDFDATNLSDFVAKEYNTLIHRQDR